LPIGDVRVVIQFQHGHGADRVDRQERRAPVLAAGHVDFNAGNRQRLLGQEDAHAARVIPALRS
jgi:hypothetical protein